MCTVNTMASCCVGEPRTASSAGNARLRNAARLSGLLHSRPQRSSTAEITNGSGARTPPFTSDIEKTAGWARTFKAHYVGCTVGKHELRVSQPRGPREPREPSLLPSSVRRPSFQSQSRLQQPSFSTQHGLGLRAPEK